MNDLFQYALRPRYYDFDPSNIVHNATYVRWLEDVRTAFQESSSWPPERLFTADLVSALTRTEIIYKAAIHLGDPVSVRLWVDKVGRSFWAVTLAFVHPETDAEYALAHQEGCFVRRSTGRPVAMPVEFLQFCRDYQRRVGARAAK